ncbi:MAG: SH3 domain-containing protein [Rectinemataceae bacterium]
MKARHNRLALALIAVLAAALSSAGLSSCSPRLGWGLLLWTAPQGPLPAGSIVPVYIKSNIEKLYVVGVPGTSKKVELPLWQIELFPSRRKAADRLGQIGSYMSLYMVAARDGLPIRASPTNDAPRVYRLRGGQSVKILAKVSGEAVTTGGQILPGDWYEVIADDGTRGYAFSYAMRIYDETKEGPPAVATSTDAASAQVDVVFSRAWRPEYFQRMIDDQRIDLDFFSLRYGLFADAVGHQIRIELPTVSQVFNYSSISQDGTTFSFEGTPLKIRIESAGRIVATWTAAADALAPAQASPPEASPAAPQETQQANAGTDQGGGQIAQGQGPQTGPAPTPEVPAPRESSAYSTTPGSDGSAVFVELAVDPRDTIRDEDIREQLLLDAFVAKGSQWKSPSAGSLMLFRSGGFTWTGRDRLPAGFLPDGVGDTGQIAFHLYLDPKLGEWDGALTMRFDSGGAGGGSGTANLLYRFTPEGLDLAPAAAGFAGLTVTAADSRFEPAAFVLAHK